MPIVVSVSVFTVAAAIVAAVRRWKLPAEDRFAVPYRAWLAAGRREVFQPGSRVDAALNVAVALSVVLAVASVTYAVAVPREGEAFTEFYLLTRGEDGELVAAEYPTESVVGESKPVVVGVGNRERRTVTYTVVVELQSIAFDHNETTVVEGQELGRFSRRLEANESWHREFAIRPTLTGERLRLAFLLYDGGVPPDPTVENAYRVTHLWVNVTSSG